MRNKDYKTSQGNAPKVSQRELADRLQIIGLDIDKNAVQHIESGHRFVTDIEACCVYCVFDVSVDALLDQIIQGNEE